MRISLFIFTLALMSNLSIASSHLPFGTEFKNKLDSTFFTESKLDLGKVDSFKSLVEKRMEELVDIIVDYEKKKKGKNKKKAMKKALKNDTVVALNNLLPILEELQTETSLYNQYQIAEKVLDLDNAIKSEITPIGSNEHLVKEIVQFARLYEIYNKPSVEYGEASNLVNPITGEIYSATDLVNLKQAKVDISKLNPPKKNGVIEEIEDIASVDVKKKFLTGDNDMHRGLSITWPAENVGTLKKIRKTQSRPKVIFESIDTEGNKKEWKLKMLMEIHSEPTAASLASALGLYSDVSNYVKSFKIYLDDQSYDEFVVDFSDYFELDDLHHLIETKGSDDKGAYIVFKEGMLEARFDDSELNRVGPYYPTSKKGKRETRAWQIFNIWVNNTDLKPGENNKLTSRYIDGELRLFGLQHDMGYGFGNWQREKPTNFKWKAIHKKTKKGLIFNFRSGVIHEGWDHVTMADGKWFTRKIAQLSREQITAAVELGNWPNKSPYNYEQLLIEKLISRRNDMVKGFGLLGEVLPNGKKIELIEFNRDIDKDAIPTNIFLEDETVDFREETKLLFKTGPLEALNDAVVSGAKALITGINNVSLEPVWYGFDAYGVIAEVLTHVDRQVVSNPSPTSEYDQFIVRDDFQLGVKVGKQFGTGVELGTEIAYVKEYSVIYPVENAEEANKRSNFIVDFKMPYRILKQGLPKDHIFISQDYIQGGEVLELGVPGALVGPGVEAEISKTVLNRTIIGHKADGSITVYEDASTSKALETEAFIDFSLFKLRQFESSSARGNIERFVTKLDGNSSDEGTLRAIDAAVFNHDFTQLKKYSAEQKIKSDFITKSSGINILGFKNWQSDLRIDDLEIFNFDSEGHLIRMDYQLDASLIKSSSWSFLQNGENTYKKVRLNSSYNEMSGEIIDPYLEINIGTEDLNTVSDEISDSYIPFFNGVAGSSKFFVFSPDIHAYNHEYGHVEFLLTLKYHKEAIEKILTMTESDFRYALADSFGISHSKIDKQWAYNTARGFRKRSMKVPEKLTLKFFGKKYSVDSIIRKASSFYRLISNAKNMQSRRDSAEKIVEAFKNLIPRKGQFYSPVFLNVINKFVGKKNYLLTAQMIIPKILELENKLPGRVRPYSQKGTKRKKLHKDKIIMSVTEALDIYEMVF